MSSNEIVLTFKWADCKILLLGLAALIFLQLQTIVYEVLEEILLAETLISFWNFHWRDRFCLLASQQTKVRCLKQLKYLTDVKCVFVLRQFSLQYDILTFINLLASWTVLSNFKPYSLHNVVAKCYFKWYSWRSATNSKPHVVRYISTTCLRQVLSLTRSHIERCLNK